MRTAYHNIIRGNMPRKHAGEFYDKAAPKKPKPKDEIPEVPSVEDAIQSFHKFKRVNCLTKGFYTVLTPTGTAKILHTSGSNTTVVAIKDKIVSAIGSRTIVKVNLDFPNFIIIQLVVGNCKISDEIYDMTYQPVKQSNLKELWNQKYDQRRFAEG